MKKLTRRVESTFGSAAEDAASHIVEVDLRRSHENGDRLAIFECIAFCHAISHPLPRWVVDALAAAIEGSWKDGCKSIYKVLVGLPAGGPNPHTKRSNKRKKDQINAAVDVVKESKYRGKKAYEMVGRIMEKQGLNLGCETIKNAWTHRGEFDGPGPGTRASARLELIKLRAAD